MKMQVGYYALSLFAGTLIAGAVAIIAWRRAVTPIGRRLTVLMGAVFIWSLSAAFEAAEPERAVKVLLSKIEYLGIATVPVLMFLFAIQFLRSGRNLHRDLRALLWGVPVITIALAFTNEWHGLIWSGFAPTAAGNKNLLLYTHGTWFWIHAAYSYALLAATTVLLILAWFRFKGVFRRQAAALLMAFAMPWVGNAIYLSGLAGADKGYDFTSVGFAFSGLFLLWAMFRFQLVDIVPVARERVIESMGESLVILDETGRLAAANPAARRLIADVGGPGESASEAKLLGRMPAELFPGWPDLGEALAAPAAGVRELTIVKDDGPRHYDLRFTALVGHGSQVTGWVAVLYDVTRLKMAETAAIEARKIAETLREAGLTLSAKLDFDQISSLILELLKRVIPYDIGAFLTLEGGELKMAAIKRPADVRNLIGETFPAAGTRLCNTAVQMKRPLISPISSPEDVLLPLRPDQDVRWFLGVPIVYRDRVTGLIALYNFGNRAFTEADARVAELFASQVAIAMENSRQVAQYERQAVTDVLTGLYNRRAFIPMGEKEVGRARRYRRPLALILFDIDHFKKVNDAHGHIIGDRVLQVLTNLVTKTTRATDLVCRYGGEEFIVLMPEANREEGLAMAERLRQEISRMTVVTEVGDLSLTVSLGVAALAAEEDEALENLISRADRAMYQAKAAGRNTVRG
jgi:diguanylate cyclase (GGDEF)-like protein